MKQSLKQLHPYLYARVRLKATVNILLGLSLIFSTHLPSAINTRTAQASQLDYILPFEVWGAIFLVLGIGILIGLRENDINYRWTRRFLSASFIYSFFWLVVLVLTIIAGYPRTASVMILWGYWVYNQFLIIRDPSWAALKIVVEAKNGGLRL